MDLKDSNQYASISGLAKRKLNKNQINVNTPNKTYFRKVMKEYHRMVVCLQGLMKIIHDFYKQF